VRLRIPPRGALAAAVGVVAADQLSKWVVLSRLASLPYRVFDGLQIAVFHNRGISFSQFSGGGSLVIALVVAVVVLIVGVWLAAPRSVSWPLAFVVGGAVSNNLIDRLRWGYVVDFVSVSHWPTFNLADAAIVVGAIVAAVMVAFRR
jgi:signal peptidase II